MTHPELYKLREIVERNDPHNIFTISHLIGSGTYGKVYKAFKKGTDEAVAIKIMKVDPKDDMRSICQEISTLNACKHKNIVNFFGSYLLNNKLWICMEYCGGQSIQDIYLSTRVSLEEKCIAFISRETLRGLAYMHSRGRIHRDIKGANILLTDLGDVKVADFGIAAQINSTRHKRDTVIGTPYWMAPEVASSKFTQVGYDTKCDVWGVGITAIEYAELQPPMFDFLPTEALLILGSRKFKPPTLYDKSRRWSSHFHSFINECLKKDPLRRKDAARMLQHSFVTDPTLSVELTQKLIFLKRSLEGDGRMPLPVVEVEPPRSVPLAKPAPVSKIPGFSDASGQLFHAYSHLESTSEPAKSVNRPRQQQQPFYQSPVEYVYRGHSNASTPSSQEQQISSVVVPINTNLVPGKVVNNESVPVSSAYDQRRSSSNVSMGSVYIAISPDYPNNTGNHTEANTGDTGGQSSIVSHNYHSDLLRDVMDAFHKRNNADAPHESDDSRSLLPDKYSPHSDQAKRVLSNSDQRVKPPLRAKRLAPSPPNLRSDNGDRLADIVLSSDMSILTTSDPQDIHRLSRRLPNEGPPPRPPPPKLDAGFPRTPSQKPFHCGDDDYGLGLPATPKVHMGACFTLIFEGCSLMVNCTVTWVDPATRSQIIMFGTNDGIYYLNLVELADGAMHLLVPRRCLWLYVFKDTMMSICGQPPKLFSHNLVSLMKMRGPIQNKLWQKRFQPTIKVPNTRGCQAARVIQSPYSGVKYLCAALENTVILMEWYHPRNTFIETRRVSVSRMPSPLMLFELLFKKEQKLPLICLGVFRTQDPLVYRLDLINLNEDNGRDLSFTKPEIMEKQMEVIKIAQLDHETLLVCTASHALTLDFQGQLALTSNERNKVLQFGTLATSIVCLPDSLLIFHAHGLRGISFTGELTQDINDEKNIYRLLGDEPNVIVEKRSSESPMSEANICLLAGHRDAGKERLAI